MDLSSESSVRSSSRLSPQDELSTAIPTQALIESKTDSTMGGLLRKILRVPRPRAFLYFMSLRIGAEMISHSMVFNKLTGFFGLLAVLTGFSLSLLQLSMYIYSVGALILTAILMPHIRKQSPFQCLALAWFYLIDTLVNTAYTAAFALTWFIAVSADAANKPMPNTPGSEMMGDTAGFTDPKYNVSKVDVVATPAGAGQEAVAVGVPAVAAALSGNPSLAHGVGIEESIPSLMMVAIFTVIRIYFILILMSYARQVLRGSVQHTAKLHLHTDGASDARVESRAENPFAAGKEAGEGWRGKLGRVMVAMGEDYWLGGGDMDEEWVRGLDGRFNTKRTASGPPGTFERERRARSGTGPPKPNLNPGATKA